jgi:hypothetical protein
MKFSVSLFCFLVLVLIDLISSRSSVNHASQPKLKNKPKPKQNTAKKVKSPPLQKSVPLRDFPAGKQGTSSSPPRESKLSADRDGVIPDPRFQLPEFRINVDIPTLSNNDRLLFLGSRNAFQGSTVNGGFIKLFEKEMKKVFPQFQAFAYTVDLSSTSVSLSSSILNNSRQLFHSFQPTKVIFLFENDILESSSRSSSDDHSVPLSEDDRSLVLERKRDLELLVARFINLSNDRMERGNQAVLSPEDSELLMEAADETSAPTRLKIILTSVCAIDDCYLYRNKKDPVFEEWNDILIQLTQFYDNQVSYFDLTTPVLKLFEAFPAFKEDHSHRIVTYDGKHLNKLGHYLLAVELLNGFAGNMMSRMDLPSLQKVIFEETESYRKKHEDERGFSQVVSSSAREDL